MHTEGARFNLWHLQLKELRQQKMQKALTQEPGQLTPIRVDNASYDKLNVSIHISWKPQVQGNFELSNQINHSGRAHAIRNRVPCAIFVRVMETYVKWNLKVWKLMFAQSLFSRPKPKHLFPGTSVDSSCCIGIPPHPRSHSAWHSWHLYHSENQKIISTTIPAPAYSQFSIG